MLTLGDRPILNTKCLLLVVCGNTTLVHISAAVNLCHLFLFLLAHKTTNKWRERRRRIFSVLMAKYRASTGKLMQFRTDVISVYDINLHT